MSDSYNRSRYKRCNNIVSCKLFGEKLHCRAIAPPRITYAMFLWFGESFPSLSAARAFWCGGVGPLAIDRQNTRLNVYSDLDDSFFFETVFANDHHVLFHIFNQSIFCLSDSCQTATVDCYNDTVLDRGVIVTTKNDPRNFFVRQYSKACTNISLLTVRWGFFPLALFLQITLKESGVQI